MILLLQLYVAGAAVYLASELVDAARGRSELSIGTAIVAVIWPAWALVCISLLIWVFVAVLLEDRK